MHDRPLSRQERRFEMYVNKRGGRFQIRKNGEDPFHRFFQCLVIFDCMHAGKRFEQVTLVTEFDVVNDARWQELLDMLNGTFARALERHVRGVH